MMHHDASWHHGTSAVQICQWAMDGHGIIHNLPMDRAVSGGMCSVSDLLHLAQATDAHDPAMLQVGPKVRSVIEVCRKMGIRDVPKWQFLGGQMMTNY